MARAYSPTEILAKKYRTLAWSEKWETAFGNPETSGVWFVWGNSGNGKTSFIMDLVKELGQHGRVFMNALEEGTRLTMQHNLKRAEMHAVKRNVLIGKEDMPELSERLKKRRSPDFIIVDSFQYARLTWPSYIKLKEAYPEKLFVFISHAEGKQPAGRTAKQVRYDADLKIWVEGFQAISNGRYNPGGIYTIWEERANAYHGINKKK